MKSINILLIEDDALQASYIRTALVSGGDFAITTYSTEAVFRREFVSISRTPPDLFIMDLMIPWTDVEMLEEMPPQIAAEGSYTAGLRCLRMIREDSITANLPVLFYSVSEHWEVIPAQDPLTQHVSKDLGDLRPLVSRVKEMLGLSKL